jgi:hypothetical protein
MPNPKKNESIMFWDFLRVGLQLPLSKKFADILAAYRIQNLQLKLNSFPLIMKFLWARQTYAGDNDVDTFVLHFEIHWPKRTVTIGDEDKEVQYGCCTFQTRRVNKN